MIKYLSACIFFLVITSVFAKEKQNLSCKITIIGGGPAGVYLSYKLAPTYGSDICLFEKEKALGGRMKDEIYSNHTTGKKVFVGLGARRVNRANKEVIALAKELGITLQEPEQRTQLIHHHGVRSYSTTDFQKLYPKSKGPYDQDPSTNLSDEIWQQLMDQRQLASLYPTLRDYVSGITSKDDQLFVRAMTRFRADFDLDISPSNYLEMLEVENQNDSVDLYPVGGMQQFVKRMAEKAKKNGVRIFTSEPLLEFKETKTKGGYLAETTSKLVKTDQLVLAIPPLSLDHIKGELVEEIRNQTEYQAMIPIPVVVINQQWPYAWWKDIKNSKVKGSKALTWRAWTTDHCISHVEIPQEDYLSELHITRSVYSDDPKCVKMWEELFRNKGITVVAEKVVAGLRLVFNYPVPKPLSTSIKIWPGAWYYGKAGIKVSNQEIARWSIEPLTNRKNLMLAGEAYWMNRPGWSEGAYFSVNKLLSARFMNNKTH